MAGHAARAAGRARARAAIGRLAHARREWPLAFSSREWPARFARRERPARCRLAREAARFARALLGSPEAAARSPEGGRPAARSAGLSRERSERPFPRAEGERPLSASGLPRARARVLELAESRELRRSLLPHRAIAIERPDDEREVRDGERPQLHEHGPGQDHRKEIQQRRHHDDRQEQRMSARAGNRWPELHRACVPTPAPPEARRPSAIPRRTPAGSGRSAPRRVCSVRTASKVLTRTSSGTIEASGLGSQTSTPTSASAHAEMPPSNTIGRAPPRSRMVALSASNSRIWISSTCRFYTLPSEEDANWLFCMGIRVEALLRTCYNADELNNSNVSGLLPGACSFSALERRY